MARRGRSRPTGRRTGRRIQTRHNARHGVGIRTSTRARHRRTRNRARFQVGMSSGARSVTAHSRMQTSGQVSFRNSESRQNRYIVPGAIIVIIGIAMVIIGSTSERTFFSLPGIVICIVGAVTLAWGVHISHAQKRRASAATGGSRTTITNNQPTMGPVPTHGTGIYVGTALFQQNEVNREQSDASVPHEYPSTYSQRELPGNPAPNHYRTPNQTSAPAYSDLPPSYDDAMKMPKPSS